MSDDAGGLIGGLIALIFIIAIVAVIIYCIVLIASFLAGVAGVGGIAWGSGTAIYNYGQSFKENMIDSNKVTA